MLNEEMIAKAKEAKSVEELLALAKENGVAMTEKEAAKYFANLHKEGALSDDELDNVAGGGCKDEAPQPKFHAGDTVYLGNPLNTAKVLEYAGCDEVHGFYYNIYCLRKHTYETGFEWEMTLC